MAAGTASVSAAVDICSRCINCRSLELLTSGAQEVLQQSKHACMWQSSATNAQSQSLFCGSESVRECAQGRPGVGKTTSVREVARLLSEEHHKRVVIVDTSNEIGGDGNIPHPGIGGARRMQARRRMLPVTARLAEPAGV